MSDEDDRRKAANEVRNAASSAAHVVEDAALQAADVVKTAAEEARDGISFENEKFASTPLEVARRNLVLDGIERLASSVESHTSVSRRLIDTILEAEKKSHRVAIVGAIVSSVLVLFFGSKISMTTRQVLIELRLLRGNNV